METFGGNSFKLKHTVPEGTMDIWFNNLNLPKTVMKSILNLIMFPVYALLLLVAIFKYFLCPKAVVKWEKEWHETEAEFPDQAPFCIF